MASHPHQRYYDGDAKLFVGEDAKVQKKDGDLRYGLHESVEDLRDIVELFSLS